MLGSTPPLPNPDIFTHHRNLLLWNFLSLVQQLPFTCRQRGGKGRRSAGAEETTTGTLGSTGIQASPHHAYCLQAAITHRGLFARGNREQISFKEQDKMKLYETVWVCVCVLLSGRPSVFGQ